MSSPGVLDGTRPYRFLDETSVSNGYVRLRALLLLPALLVLLAGLILGYELGSPVEDRDARDAAWDYRTTATQSTAFHAYFRAAYWPSYKAMDINPEVYREVVVAARDRPVVLALHPPDALCLRAVTVPCLAARPSHRPEHRRAHVECICTTCSTRVQAGPAMSGLACRDVCSRI